MSDVASPASPSRRARFLAALAAGPLVVDGAMGTQLYERGVLFTVNFEELVLTRPELIIRVHEDFARAGATVLETNTFGANPTRLARHGLESKLHEINVAAVARARAGAMLAGGNMPLIAGAMGPTGLLLSGDMAESERTRLRDGFRAQADALAEGGADVLLVETMRQPAELRVAIEAARETGLPIIALASFDEGSTLADGTSPEAIARVMVDLGADVVGANCSEGPKTLFEVAERMLGAFANPPPVCIIPNAGLPRRIDDRTVYMATPEYFQLYARRMFKLGVRMVGGCCGTTPEHIRKIAAAARMVGGDRPDEPRIDEERSASVPPACAPGQSIIALEDKSAFGRQLSKAERFVVSVEVNAPPGLSLKKALDAAKMLIAGGVDVINVADGPRASARMSNLALVHRIQQEVGCEALLHVCCRDRNLLGTIGHLLAAHELGIHNLVIITGDPPKMGDFPDATAVFDLDSIGLLRLASHLNRGFDPGGRALGGVTSFVCATGAEPAALNATRELDRLRKKRDAGAELVMTQPVYDVSVLDRFLEAATPIGLPIMVGILPLASHRNAEFLHNEVPGMQIPEHVRERMRKAGTGAPARREGVAIAREMLQAIQTRPLVRGAYIMPPLERYEAALEVIDGLVR